jgi:outer membrane protein
MKAIFLFTTLLLAFALPSSGQDHLSLTDAVGRALSQNPAVRSAQAEVGEAAERVTEARSGYLPRVDLVEAAQRGNQPVFAFSSLLSARRFAPSDFAIDALNRPDAITSYHTALSFEQPIFDGLRTRTAVRAARIGHTLAETQQVQTREDLALNATRAYGQVVLAGAAIRAAGAAVQAAEDDVARAELNQAIGEPLDRQFVLDDVPAVPAPAEAVADLEREAMRARPEVRTASLQEELARETRRGARAAFLPQVSFQGVVELNGVGGAFTSRASAWTFGAQARWSLFAGLADVSRLRETGLASARAAADRERAETAVRLDVRTASARVLSAVARGQVGQAAVAQAQESQRIIRDRYEAGMASVNDVLRAANAVLDAESQRIGALVDLLVSHAMLDRALGRVPGAK